MKTKEKLLFNLFVFLLLSISILGISRFSFFSPVRGAFDELVVPFGKISHSFLKLPTQFFSDSNVLKLEEEKKELIKKLADQKKLQEDLAALRDQFEISNPESSSLLPVYIVGAPGFMPSGQAPELFIVDKGIKDGLVKGQAVVVGNNLVGKVVEVSGHLAKISLLSDPSFSTPAKTANGKIIGLVKGKGNSEIILDNVLLSDTLSSGDIIVTKGALDMHGVGIPPDLVIGTIISLDKKPSALFQTAKLKGNVDLPRLDMVFVVK